MNEWEENKKINYYCCCFFFRAKRLDPSGNNKSKICCFLREWEAVGGRTNSTNRSIPFHYPLTGLLFSRNMVKAKWIKSWKKKRSEVEQKRSGWLLVVFYNNQQPTTNNQQRKCKKKKPERLGINFQ